METLQKLFNMWLNMLYACVTEDAFTSIIWAFVCTMVAFILLKLWRGVLE